MIDPTLFSNALANGRSQINSLLGRQSFSNSPSNGQINYNSNSNGQMRTDRNSNPTAMTSDAARTMGLTLGVDYVQGDPFPNNPNLHTAKFLKDPIATSIKAIDNGGFYTASGKPRWSYLNDISGVNNWKNLDYNGKIQVIKQMYQHEGGDGSLIAGLNNSTIPSNFSSPLAYGGGGGPRTTQSSMSFQPPTSSAIPPTQKFNNLYSLGNITTRFGDADRDTSFHSGTDLANKTGTPVPKEGVGGVVETVKNNDGDYGNQIAIRNQDGTREYYSHLHQMMVRPGQQVKPGETIATMGSTGNTYSPTGGDASHLHLEVKDPNGNFINPEQYYNS